MIRFFQLLGVIGVWTLACAPLAVAKNYTATGNKKEAPAEQSAIPPQVAQPTNPNLTAKEPCSATDLDRIDRFNKKADPYIEAYKAFKDRAADVHSTQDSEKFAKYVQEITAFFDSKEFNAMEDVYKRCDQSMPKPPPTPAFWAP